MRRSYSVRFLLWVALILLIVVPWTSFVGHAEGHQVGWIPFVTPPIRTRDVFANILLYVPFGYWYPRRRTRTSIVEATFWALLLSLGTETAQLFSHGRFTSATDVVCNTLGAAAGVVIVSLRQRRG